MSLFKARECWSTVVGDNEMFDLGCLCVADLLNSGYDQVIVGSYHRRLTIYQPKVDISNGFKAEDVLIDTQLSEPVIQVETGHFVSGSSSVYIAVLHPRKFAVFQLAAIAKDGMPSFGTQYQLRSVYEHKLQRTSFNFCYGPFGGVKDRDFICIQSVDGTISVFEQETFSFSRFLPGALLPGPIRYIRPTESIVTVTSSCQIDCFKFQKLAHATGERDEGQNITKAKPVVADWTFLINEIGLDIVVTKFGKTPLTIFILGERNLYALSEAGQLLYMKKFDYNPSCFLPHAAGKNNSILCMVGTHNQSLVIYEGITMKWASRLSFVPVQLKVASLQGLQGVIVALDDEGHLSCLYLGTDPSFVSHPSAYPRELDYSRVDAEMKQLQEIIKDHQLLSVPLMPTSSSAVPVDDELKITISVSPTLGKEAFDTDVKDEMPIPSVAILIQLQAKRPIDGIKLSCIVASSLVASEPVTNIPTVAPGKPVEVRVTCYMKHRVIPTNLMLVTTATYYSANGAPRVVQSRARLPVSLVIRPCQPVKNAVYKLTIDTNKPTANLGELFSDLWGSSSESAASAIGFKFYGLEPVITILAAKSTQRYRLQCDNFGSMSLMVYELVARLASLFKMGPSSDFRMFYESSLPLQEYFEVIDKHFECRSEHEVLSKELEENAAQFRVIQKRLLILFKDKTPTSLKNLDTLLDFTYEKIMSLSESIESNKEVEQRLSAELSCTTSIINSLIRLKHNLSPEDFKVLESALSPAVRDNSTQGWEEMVEASVTHLLRTNLSKKVKDVTFNPTPLAMTKDTQNVKKYIAMLCDRIAKGARLSDEVPTGITQHRKPTKQKETSSSAGSNKQGGPDYHSLLASAPRDIGGQRSAEVKSIPDLAGGEPNSDTTASAVRGDGTKDFKKKTKESKAADNFQDRGQPIQDSNAMKFRNDELIYGVD